MFIVLRGTTFIQHSFTFIHSFTFTFTFTFIHNFFYYSPQHDGWQYCPRQDNYWQSKTCRKKITLGNGVNTGNQHLGCRATDHKKYKHESVQPTNWNEFFPRNYRDIPTFRPFINQPKISTIFTSSSSLSNDELPNFLTNSTIPVIQSHWKY